MIQIIIVPCIDSMRTLTYCFHYWRYSEAGFMIYQNFGLFYIYFIKAYLEIDIHTCEMYTAYVSFYILRSGFKKKTVLSRT